MQVLRCIRENTYSTIAGDISKYSLMKLCFHIAVTQNLKICVSMHINETGREDSRGCVNYDLSTCYALVPDKSNPVAKYSHIGSVWLISTSVNDESVTEHVIIHSESPYKNHVSYAQ